MRDHNYIDSSGRRIPVAELPLGVIHELLANPDIIGIQSNGEGILDPRAAVLERLRIELLIRELGL